ncbi:MAG: hypothetical protein H0X30_07885 [Anaerolineae bacterium]|nr:hypothetical protein [Anaerolineae bacterium]
MTRFYLRLTLLPLIIFTAVLLLIHARPYDDHELRELLLPEGCPAPCFMGIRPGVTTMDEALKSLVADNRVDINLAAINLDTLGSYYDVQLNESTARLIDMHQRVQFEFQNTPPHVISKITLYPTSQMSVGDIYLFLGKPDLYVVIPNTITIDGVDQPIASVYRLYHGLLTVFLTVSNCPINLNEMVKQPIYEVEFHDKLRTDFPYTSPDLEARLKRVDCV